MVINLTTWVECSRAAVARLTALRPPGTWPARVLQAGGDMIASGRLAEADAPAWLDTAAAEWRRRQAAEAVDNVPDTWGYAHGTDFEGGEW
jgi:hypothetical protein